MPKLCLSRASVSAPFSVPSTRTLRPRNRPMPPITAASSAKARSPASGTKSLDQPADVVEAVRPLGMARDLNLLPRRQRANRSGAAGGWRCASRRPTSSAMLSSPSVDRWRSSSILPSSSAIGRSKSRKWRHHLAARQRVRGLDQPAQPVALRHAYRSASSRYRRARASAARCADRRRGRADGWRRRGAAHAATACPGRGRP